MEPHSWVGCQSVTVVTDRDPGTPDADTEDEGAERFVEEKSGGRSKCRF